MSSESATAAVAHPSRAERLRGHARYLVLLADELDALGRGEASRLREVGARRRELEGALDAPGVGALVAEALRTLEEHERLEELRRDQWVALESDSVRSARELRVTAVGRGRYLDLPLVEEGRIDTRF